MRMTRYVRKSLQIRSNNKASPRSILAWRQTDAGRRPDLRRTPSTTEAPRFGWGGDRGAVEKWIYFSAVPSLHQNQQRHLFRLPSSLIRNHLLSPLQFDWEYNWSTCFVISMIPM